MECVWKHISEIFGRKPLIISQIHGGISSAMKLKVIYSDRVFFCKIFDLGDGFVGNEKSQTVSIMDMMYNNVFEINGVKSYGVHVFDSQIYVFQDYVNGITLNLNDITEKDIKKIAFKIAQIHRKKDINLSDSQKKKSYVGSYRKILVDDDMVFGIWENIPGNANFVVKEIFSSYFDAVMNCEYNRLTFLHGDFRYGNILKDKNGEIFFVDFSRIPYGEPGIDVGIFIANLELEYIITKDDRYKRLADLFLEEYIFNTGDHKIGQYTRIGKLFVLFLFLMNKIRGELSMSHKIGLAHFYIDHFI